MTGDAGWSGLTPAEEAALAATLRHGAAVLDDLAAAIAESAAPVKPTVGEAAVAHAASQLLAAIERETRHRAAGDAAATLDSPEVAAALAAFEDADNPRP